MSKFKVGDLVHVALEDQGRVPEIGRVVGVFPGGARVSDWEDGGGNSGWSIGDDYLTRALLRDVFAPGDYLLARRQVIEDFGAGQKRKTQEHVRIVVGRYSVNGTRVYSVADEFGNSICIDMHDFNPWEIFPGEAEDWEHKVS